MFVRFSAALRYPPHAMVLISKLFVRYRIENLRGPTFRLTFTHKGATCWNNAYSALNAPTMRIPQGVRNTADLRAIRFGNRSKSQAKMGPVIVRLATASLLRFEFNTMGGNRDQKNFV